MADVLRFDKNQSPFIVQSSGIKNADGVIQDNACVLHSLIVITNGVNDATVVLYDHASAASGTVVAKVVVPGTNLYGGESNIMVACDNGIYADVTGTGATFIVRYID